MVSLGPKRGWATPRMGSFSFRGLIHNFLRASPPISYGSPPLPPGIDQPGGQDGWILAEFFDLFYYQIYLFIDFILYLCLFFLCTVYKHTRKERQQYSAILTEQK